MIDRVLPLLVVVVVVGVLTLWYRRREGAATATTATFDAVALRDLGVPLRTTAIVLFTAPGCAPCEPAKRVLEEIAGLRDVPLVVADVSEHHAVAAAQHVYRAPTTFLIDTEGRALTRISGVPRAEEVTHVLDGAGSIAA